MPAPATEVLRARLLTTEPEGQLAAVVNVTLNLGGRRSQKSALQRQVN